MPDAFICDEMRMPIGCLNGSLAGIRADDLAAILLRALTERNPGVEKQRTPMVDEKRCAWVR